MSEVQAPRKPGNQMTQRFRLPPGGDVPPVTAARRLGLSLEAFTAALPELQKRAPPFPDADPTTGNYDLDAIDAWRRRRYPHLFLTAPSGPLDARSVAAERVRKIRG